MRKIKSAPKFSFEAIGKLMQQGMDAVPGPLVNGKYLHWNELIRRNPPAGLTHDDWWQALKFRRLASHHLPLFDTEGRPFSFLLLDQIQEQLHHIDLRGGGTVKMPAQITNPETKERYYVSSLIEEAITSSQIEGASTTSRVAREMLRKGRPPRDTSERMILNNFFTLRHIGEIKHQDLTPELVFDIHRLVAQDTLENPNHLGAFRQPEDTVYVTDADAENIFTPPPAKELPERMARMCDFANGKSPDYFIHPAVRSMILHFWLAYDHPFVDGNGRVARALFYWSMLRRGYWLFEYLSISHAILRHRKRYDLAYLHCESDENDLTYFLDFHTNVIQESLRALLRYLAQKATELQAADRQLKKLAEFNHRQKALIAHTLRHPHADYTVESHRRSHNVTYETARTDLLQLADAGLLLKEKPGKAFVFRASPLLHDYLAADL